MMFGIVLLLSLAAAVRGSSSTDETSSSDNFLDRLDLKNFKSVESVRTDTSTSSSDESSDASRVARAVEAALKEADLADRLAAARRAAGNGLRFRPDESGLFRLRLQTFNRPNTCASFSCTAVGAIASVADLENTVVTATVIGGSTRTAVFNSTGFAVNKDDVIGAFQVQAALVGGRNVQFTLSTLNTNFGLNITSIRFQSGVPGAPNGARRVYFDALNNAFWLASNGAAVGDSNIKVTEGTTGIIGCDAGFDTFENRGVTQFTISANNTAPLIGDSTLVLNVTGNLTFVFNVDVFALNNVGIGKLALDTLPCATRSAVTYDEIVVANLGQSEAKFASDHPLVYDALRAQTLVAAPSFDNLVRELQQAAGRTQLVLRDLMLDRSAFSALSHSSKYTSCFRALPNTIDVIEAYIGMRSQTGTDGVVRVQAKFGDNGSDQGQLTNDNSSGTDPKPVVFRSESDSTLSLGQALLGVVFEVRELIFSSLGQTLKAEEFFDNFEGPVPFRGSVSKPYAQLPSDVTVRIEVCPQFNYFA